MKKHHYMKALLLTEYKNLNLVDFPQPEMGPEDVLVRVRACGICGSDVHGFDGSTGRRIPPLVMGHEAAGVIAAVGTDVKNLREGDRVTFDSTVSCGRCYFCRRGEINLCEERQVLGVSCGEYRRHGAFAEFISVPARIVYPLPDSLRFEQAALIETLSIAVHAVDRMPVRLGDTAVVVGTGMVGLLVVQVLRAKGCGEVFAVDLDDHKLGMAENLGAAAGFNPRNTNAIEEIRARTSGRGADLAVEVVGASDPVKTSIACVRKGGSVSLVGNLSPSIELPLQSVVTREITLYGSCACRGEFPVSIGLVASGAVRVDPLISARAPLEEGREWFGRLYGHEPKLMKVILEP
jgi:L-iditol 2-dehydrogenase